MCVMWDGFWFLLNISWHTLPSKVEPWCQWSLAMRISLGRNFLEVHPHCLKLKLLRRHQLPGGPEGKAVMDMLVKIFWQPPPLSNHSKRGQLAPENVSSLWIWRDGGTNSKSIPLSRNLRQENWRFDMFVICRLFYYFGWLFFCLLYVCWFMWSYKKLVLSFCIK